MGRGLRKTHADSSDAYLHLVLSLSLDFFYILFYAPLEIVLSFLHKIRRFLLSIFNFLQPNSALSSDLTRPLHSLYLYTQTLFGLTFRGIA